MSILKINDIVLPNPSTYRVSKYDMDSDDTKRSETGYLQRDRIRAGVYKIEVSWEALTVSELTSVATAMAPAELHVTFFDPTTFTDGLEKTMYSGDKIAEIVRKMNVNDKTQSYWSFSTTLTEY